MASELLKLQGELDQFLSKVTKTVAVEVTYELIKTTPEDTGFAHSNWVPSTGSPFSGLAGTYEAALGGSLNRGPQKIGLLAVNRAYTISKGPIFVTNNVDYIDLLNHGYSAQAPSGFVQATIAVVLRRLATGRFG